MHAGGKLYEALNRKEQARMARTVQEALKWGFGEHASFRIDQIELEHAP